MPLLISCPSCDGRFRVPDHRAGKQVTCPMCNKPFVVRSGVEDANPSIWTSSAIPHSLGAAHSSAIPQAAADPLAVPIATPHLGRQSDDFIEIPWSKICLFAGVIAVVVFLLVVFFTLSNLVGSKWGAFFILAFLLLMFLIVALAVSLPIFLAKNAAIRDQKEEVSLYGGLIKLILWEANQGLVLLRNKRISKVIYGPKDGGGTKFIFPVLGDELRVRVPLTLKLTQFSDGTVLTRESMQLTLKVALWWRVANLEKYYYLIDKQVHVITDHYRHDKVAEAPAPEASPWDGTAAQQSAAEKWMLTSAESCIRKIVSQSTTAFLVSKTATSYLHIEDQHPPQQSGPGQAAGAYAPPNQAATPNVLADEIHQMLRPKVAEYGLEIDRVEIQDVKLPDEIQRALNAVFTATLKPAQTEQEARAEQIRLRGAAEVLGVDNIALIELMKGFKGSTFVGRMPKFIEALFAQNMANAQSKSAPALPGPASGGAVVP